MIDELIIDMFGYFLAIFFTQNLQNNLKKSFKVPQNYTVILHDRSKNTEEVSNI